MKTTCGIFLYDNTDKFLIVHPTNHPFDVWSIPKGMIDENETYLEAAIRELKEETSIDLNTMEYTIIDDIIPFKYETTDKQLKSFKIKINTIIDTERLICTSYFTHPTKARQKEVDMFRMVSSDEIHLLHKTQQQSFNHALQSIH